MSSDRPDRPWPSCIDSLSCHGLATREKIARPTYPPRNAPRAGHLRSDRAHLQRRLRRAVCAYGRC